MLSKVLKVAPKAMVEVCERCASVCDDACRSEAIRGAALDRVLDRGLRWA